MSNVETYQLCHPELLSKVTLCEILKNSCIVLPIFESLSKEELVEIFKRIAMPMPQRRYNESRKLGKKLSDLRASQGIEIASCDEKTDDSRTADSLLSITNSRTKNKLTPFTDESQQNSKKIRLSNSCQIDTSSDKDMKRKNEISSIAESKKRQKITWP